MSLTLKQLEYQREWVKTHKEVIVEYRKKHYKKHNQEISDYGAKIRNNTKEKLFNILGHKCIECGNTDKRVLQFDHINGNGHKWRMSLTSGFTKLNVLLKLPNLKDEIQVLCANCNWVKRYENKELRRFD